MSKAASKRGQRRRGQRRPRIGTSGWSYPSWRAGFYEGVPQRRWLAHCAAHFTAIEVNATFYREMKPALLERWRDETPDDFAFAIKGHRYITHVERLKAPSKPVRRQRDTVAPLGPKLAAVLWQLPKTLQKDMKRLNRFLDALEEWPGVRHALEFRHASWFDDEVADALSRRGCANCLSDAADWPLWDAVTTDLVYVRLHGHTRTYASSYGERALGAWAKRVTRWMGEGREVHVYFDNDAEGAAPYNALRLLELVAPTRKAKRS
ncbi:MAG: DUF72 domain-containing protein [Alphaproteobacteria bacterium]